MPIDSPRLDDITYDSAVDDLVRRIPVYTPLWTDFNQSDPGITLLQLVASLAEQLGWRLNRMPEKAHIELLKLLGVSLAPATAARTRLAVLLADPAAAIAFTLAGATQAAAKTGSPPPIFSTLAAADIVPAQLSLLVTTRNPLLNDVRKASEDATTDEAPSSPLEPDDFPADDSEWLSLRWDGKKPKDKDLPAQPIALLPAKPRPHRYLWLGLQFNGAPDAGFLGTRATLTAQLDDDEQPTRLAIEPCGPAAPLGETPPLIDWLHYYDVAQRKMLPVPGRIDDATAQLTRSGGIRFTVPATLGAIADADWKPLQEAGSLSPLDACLAFGGALGAAMGDDTPMHAAVSAIADHYRQDLTSALDTAWAALPPSPALDGLVDALGQRLQELSTDAVSTPIDLATATDQALAAVREIIQGFVDPSGDLPASYAQSIVDLLVGGVSVGDAAAFYGALLSGLDDDARRNELIQRLHASFHDVAAGAIARFMADAVASAQPVVDDIRQVFRDPVDAGVAELWALPEVDATRTALAQYYRGAVADAVAGVWQQPPTAEIAQLADGYRDAVEQALGTVTTAAAEIAPFVAHPLAAKYRGLDKVAGWIRITLPDELAVPDLTAGPKLRHLGFNVVDAENAQEALNEVVGAASGEPGLELALRNRNVLAASLLLAVQEDADPTVPLTPWSETPTLDDQDPFARVFVLDREAGRVLFGDGVHGRIPPLVPGGGLIVAQRYRYGGGVAGEVGVGAIAALRSAPAAVAAAVNIVAATGGHDAETLAQAEIRARKELSTRSRAVVADDFVWFAEQTPEVRVGRALCVPLRRPLAEPGQGLDTVVAPGAVSVVAVPDQRDVPEPLPTKSFLRAVCRNLDRYRLVTTELHVVPPQYCRLSGFQIAVMARPGWTRSQLQDLVEARLGQYLHPLTGGDDGTGFPFGGQLHVADIVALVFRVDGVERVDSLSCAFARSKTNASPRVGRLVLCPAVAGDVERIDLAPEECASVDVSTLTLTTVV